MIGSPSACQHCVGGRRRLGRWPPAFCGLFGLIVSVVRQVGGVEADTQHWKAPMDAPLRALTSPRLLCLCRAPRMSPWTSAAGLVVDAAAAGCPLQGLYGAEMRAEVLRRIEKWQEPPPAKQVKPLPVPDAEVSASVTRTGEVAEGRGWMPCDFHSAHSVGRGAKQAPPCTGCTATRQGCTAVPLTGQLQESLKGTL
jgi:hypothetical protein